MTLPVWVDDSSRRAVEVEQFLCGIYSRYGYDFRDYSPESTSRRIVQAARWYAAGSIDSLLARALMEPGFFERLLPELTVPVTEIARDPAAYLAIRELVVPHLKTYPRLKIWHAGCASGEEVYSMAIMLDEEGLLERTRLYATDINHRALGAARRGRVPVQGLEAASHRHRQSGGRGALEAYLEEEAAGLVFSRRLRERIVFAEHNLVHDGSFGEMQLVVCRNVFIYFSHALRGRVMRLFADSMVRGGFLWLGTRECVPSGDAAGFEPFVREQRIYRYRSHSRPGMEAA